MIPVNEDTPPETAKAVGPVATATINYYPTQRACEKAGHPKCEGMSAYPYP